MPPFISVRQVTIAEKNIGVLNLMQLKTIDAAADDFDYSTSSFLPADSDTSLEEDITWLAKKLEVHILFTLHITLSVNIFHFSCLSMT